MSLDQSTIKTNGIIRNDIIRSVLSFLFVTLFIPSPVLFAEKRMKPVDYVNVLQGTNSEPGFSTGNTYPAVATPWGMNFWTPQTRKNGNGWQYVYTDQQILGFKQTHQPSPWINDYGCFSLMPQIDEPVLRDVERGVRYLRKNESATPYLYEVLLENGIRTSMTATHSGAALDFTYPEDKESLVLLDCFPGKGRVAIDVAGNKLIGYAGFSSKGHHLPENFGTHFVLYFDEPIQEFHIYEEGNLQAGSDQEGKNIQVVLSFGRAEKVGVRVASSFISAQQAELNYQREIKGQSLEKLAQKSRSEWNKRLSSIVVKGKSLEQKRTFYTAMYRTFLFPRKTHEWDESGNQVHYSFFDGQVHDGPMYTDNGFWDTFRAVHPLFTLIAPSLTSELMDALLNIYHEGGWLPEWFSPGYRNCMIGQNSVSVVTDAFQKGIGNFDVDEMFEAMLKGAENEGPDATGRVASDEYDSLGYIPNDIGVRQSVSRTLEYAYDDFCIAQFALLAGKSQELIKKYQNRSFNYNTVFDASIGFVRPKDSQGRWADFYAPEMWGPEFTEGSAWHWTWCVFHDPAGLVKLMGGEDAFVARMDSVFLAPPIAGLGTRKHMIHEMSEMIAGGMGQYAHGNQPIQHMPYLYNYAGAPWKTQEKVHEIARRLYHSGVEDGKGLCGDEDNGQTSAWYVFSSLGFYPVCPGTGEYIIGTPMFEEAELSLPDHKKFVVRAKNFSEDNIYIQSAKLNGKVFNESYIRHEQIVEGGVLEFVMGNQPNKEWASESRPFSLSETMKK